MYILLLKSFRISIHAPARGATGDAVRKQIQATISIHAPARGATLSFQATGVNPVYFNPRSREGSDAKAGNFGIFLPISIHAPARGATYSVVSKNNHFSNFNPRSREGSDKKNNHKILVTMISIHAPARGATQTVTVLAPKVHTFQSTLPRGERLRFTC